MHDHKFRSRFAKDYYSMQAFVAGVEYEDRPLQTEVAKSDRAAAAENMKAEIERLQKELEKFEPIARRNNDQHQCNKQGSRAGESSTTNAMQNKHRVRCDTGHSSFALRFTIAISIHLWG